ncbi:MAG: hypothetical protein AB7F23_10195 [Phycisphaerae bacterium]
MKPKSHKTVKLITLYTIFFLGALAGFCIYSLSTVNWRWIIGRSIHSGWDAVYSSPYYDTAAIEEFIVSEVGKFNSENNISPINIRELMAERRASQPLLQRPDFIYSKKYYMPYELVFKGESQIPIVYETVPYEYTEKLHVVRLNDGIFILLTTENLLKMFPDAKVGQVYKPNTSPDPHDIVPEIQLIDVRKN